MRHKFAVFIFVNYNNFMDKKVNLDEGSLTSIATLLGELLDKQTAVLATKEELRAQTIDLKAYIHEGTETVMDGMSDLEDRLDVRDRVDKLEHDVAKLKHAH
jgi:hypothetical protein